ncbi:hypothetical protein [Nocardia sp. CNY236]|uniref:hypothetical protein n=1 Tax=Nocardia sp. CNY236 TaxID=1169152 RepID=UPI0018C9D379|nr:hypothetical protein [Nocardia sp. CNY236]
MPAGGPTANASGAGGGRPGMAGMPGGMMPPGQRGKGDDEGNEHNSPDYLRGVQEQLLGPDIPAVPPAIGDDNVER